MRRALACCLLLLAFCTGCGLPVPQGTTSVRKVSGPQPGDDTDSVRRIPAGPVPGETPQAILSGFLAAGPNPDVASDYLNPASPWSPLESTTVFSGEPVVTAGPVTGDTVTATATTTPILFVAADGSTSVPPVKPLSFTLTRLNGQWRIDNPPAGTQLSQVDFAAGFRRGSLGWLSPDRRSIVRQSVLLPGDPSDLSLDLVKQLIEGPSLLLANAGVVSLLPQRLTVVSATQEGSVAVVSLQSNGASIPPGSLDAIRAQFAATLLSAEVSAVQVDIDGQPLLGGSNPGAAITVADETTFDRDIAGSDGVDARSYVETPSGISPLTLPASFAGSTPSSAPTPSGTTKSSTTGAAGVPVKAFAVSADGQRFAELRRAKGGYQPVYITASTGKPTSFGPAGDYTSLAWGADDALWLTTSAGDVYVAPRDHAPIKATHETTAMKDIVIAPDGVHVVGISTTGSVVAGLASASATPPLLNSLTVVAPSLTDVTAVAVISSGVDGLELLVAATRVANPLLPGTTATPLTELWRVSTGAPDPAAATPELLSETVSPYAPATPACAGSSVVGLATRPGAPPLAECRDGSLEAYNGTGGAAGRQWLQVGSGLAGYPLG